MFQWCFLANKKEGSLDGVLLCFAAQEAPLGFSAWCGGWVLPAEPLEMGSPVMAKLAAPT